MRSIFDNPKSRTLANLIRQLLPRGQRTGAGERGRRYQCDDGGYCLYTVHCCAYDCVLAKHTHDGVREIPS